VIAPSALMECFASSSWTPPVDEPLTGVRSPPPLATFGGVASRQDQQIVASLREVEAPPGNIACGKC